MVVQDQNDWLTDRQTDRHRQTDRQPDRVVAVEKAVAVVMQESGRRALFDATQRLGANYREKAGLINSESVSRRCGKWLWLQIVRKLANCCLISFWLIISYFLLLLFYFFIWDDLPTMMMIKIKWNGSSDLHHHRGWKERKKNGRRVKEKKKEARDQVKKVVPSV